MVELSALTNKANPGVGLKTKATAESVVKRSQVRGTAGLERLYPQDDYPQAVVLWVVVLLLSARL